MNDALSESNPLRAFVRGAWVLLLVQLAVALSVFVALTLASLQLSSILRETAAKQEELQTLRTEVESLAVHQGAETAPAECA